MRKIYLMMFPLFLVVFLTCGCAGNKDANAMCEFDCDSVITLKIGTANSSDAVAYAPLVTNTLVENLNISYDSSIIDYNIATGRIEALRSGTTRIKSTINDKTKSVQVNVEQAVYCTSLKCNDFVMEYGKTAELISGSRKAFVVNSGYNMGYTFGSLTPQILSVDSDGVVTANAVGNGQIYVATCSGVNPLSPTKYDTAWATINVTVMERRADLSLEIYNSDMTQQITSEEDEDGNEFYTLYSSKDGSVSYNLKISSDQSLKDCLFTEKTTVADCINEISCSSNNRLVVQGVYLLSQDQRTVYQSFKVVDCGTDAIQKGILESGQNFYYSSLSKRLNIRVYRQAIDSDISAKVYYSDCEKEYDLIDKIGQYCLYRGDDSGKTDSVVYVVPKISKYCNPKCNIVYENLTVQQVENGMLKVSCGENSGVGTLTIISKDGGGAKLKLTFCDYSIMQTTLLTITTDAKQTTTLYFDKDGNATFGAKFEIHDEAGNIVTNRKVVLLLFDFDNKEVELSLPQVDYYDIVDKTFSIVFRDVGSNVLCYKVMLRTEDLSYCSDVMLVYIYNENSLTK